MAYLRDLNLKEKDVVKFMDGAEYTVKNYPNPTDKLQYVELESKDGYIWVVSLFSTDATDGWEKVIVLREGVLTVRNNWETFEWYFDGERVDVFDIEEVMFKGGIFHKVYRVWVSHRVNDMGTTYTTNTVDLEIEVEVLGVPTRISLYSNKQIRNKIVDVVMKG